MCREEELEKNELLSILVGLVSYQSIEREGRSYFAYRGMLLDSLDNSKNEECNDIVKQIRKFYRENNN